MMRIDNISQNLNRADPGIKQGGADGERGMREPIMGVWGGAPSGVRGSKPP